jgi:FecR protein
VNELDDIQARLIHGDDLSADDEGRLRVALGVQAGLTTRIVRDEQVDGLLRMLGPCERDGGEFVERTLLAWDAEMPQSGDISQSPDPAATPRFDAVRVRSHRIAAPSRQSSSVLIVLSVVAAVLLLSTALVVTHFVRTSGDPIASGNRPPREIGNEAIDNQTTTPDPDKPPIKESRQPAVPVVKAKAPRRTVAGRLTADANCRWKDGRAPGPDLGTGVLGLLSGSATITFRAGAVVKLEGPADFELLSASRGHLHRGRLSAAVPRRAVGFTVETPIATIVDLGTKFRVAVDRDGATQVNVDVGKVEYRDRNPDGTTGQRIRLSAGDSHRVQPLEPKSGGDSTNRGAAATLPRRRFQGAAIINGKSYTFSTREEYEEFLRKVGRRKGAKP